MELPQLPNLQAEELFNSRDPKKMVQMIAIAVIIGLFVSFAFPSYAWLGIIAAGAAVVIYNMLKSK